MDFDNEKILLSPETIIKYCIKSAVYKDLESQNSWSVYVIKMANAQDLDKSLSF